jgi:peroxiredoxin
MKKTLRERTDAYRDELKAAAPAEVVQALDDGATGLGRRPFAATTVEVGARAPGFTLPDALGRDVSLGDLVAEGAVVLTFYRGSWCPYCNLQLNAYQQILDELEDAGARLVAVSPMTPDNSLSFAEKAGLRFTVLSDAGAQVAERYGLAFALQGAHRELHRDSGVDLPALNGDQSWRLPAPATYVIDGESVVRFAHVDGDYRWRLEPDALLTAVRAVAANSSTDRARATSR